jgi:hypothetical protein
MPEKTNPKIDTKSQTLECSGDSKNTLSESEIIKAAITALTSSNSLLQQRLDEVVNKKWLPIMTLAGTLGAVMIGFLGVNLYTQYVNMGGLDVATRNLNDERTRTADEIKKLKESTAKELTELRKETTDDVVRLKTSTEGELRKLRNDNEFASTEKFTKVSQEVNALLDADIKAHKLLASVTVGRWYLVEQKAPAASLKLSQQICEEYEEYQNKIEPNKAYTQVVNEVGPLIYGLKAESAWQSDSISDLESALSGLRNACRNSNRQCDFVERSRYEGLLSIMKANQLMDPMRIADRRMYLAEVDEHLSKVLEDSDGHEWAIVLRGVALLDFGDATQASQTFGQLVKRYTTDKLRRMPPDVRARVEVATAGEYLAKLSMESQPKLSPDFKCDIEIGSIGDMEAKQIALCLESITRRRKDYVEDPRMCNTFGLFAARLLGAIETSARLAPCSTPTQACVGCGSSVDSTKNPWIPLRDLVSQELKDRFQLDNLIDLPPLSRDSKLGRKTDAGILMKSVQISKTTQTSERIVDGRSRTVSMEVENPEYKYKIYKDQSLIVEAHYIELSDIEDTRVLPPTK